MFILPRNVRPILIVALLSAVVALYAPHARPADAGSLQSAWSDRDYETFLKEVQPLVDAGDEEATVKAGLAKLMIELQKRALAQRNSEDNADFEDYESFIREIQPLVDAGDAEAVRDAILSKLSIELQEWALTRRNAEGPTDLSDYDRRYEPMVPGPQQRRYELGKNAYDLEDYEAAFREWLPLADGGYAEAQYSIADLYRRGWGVDEDRSRAEHYYQLAAEQGYGPAEAALIFLNNPILHSKNEDDQRLSIYWALRAATNGNKNAYGTLALAYCRGVGVPKNPVLADIWLYMEYGSDDFLHERGCSERQGSINYPASYRQAIRERAEAMSKAYDIPINPEFEPRGYE